MQQAEVSAIELAEQRIYSLQFETGVAEWRNVTAEVLTRKNLTQRDLFLSYLHLQSHEYMRMNACLLLDTAVPHKHLDESSDLLFEHEVALVVEDISDICRHNIVKRVVLLLNFLQQAGDQSLILIQLEIFAVELHSLTVGAAELQESFNFALHQLAL